MTDLIKREDAIKTIVNTPSNIADVIGNNLCLDGAVFRQNEIIDILKDIPSAEKQGEWIQKKQSIDGKYDFIWTECSECHQRPHDDFESDFCPNCGARMDSK